MENKIVSVSSNSFGDQVIYYILDGVPKSATFPEGNWKSPEEFLKDQIKLLKGDFE